MSETSTSYWNNTREGLRIVELRAAGFKPADAAGRNAIVTVASPYTNAHRCNNRVRRIADLLVEMIAQRGGRRSGQSRPGGVGRHSAHRVQRVGPVAGAATPQRLMTRAAGKNKTRLPRRKMLTSCRMSLAPSPCCRQHRPGTCSWPQRC
jgi:hypothetical protein